MLSVDFILILISLRLDSCEAGFMVGSLLEVVAFKRVHLRFGLEASDVWVKFISLFRFHSLFPVRLMEKNPSLLCPWIAVYC